MKNRIFWILESVPTNQQSSFEVAPWALFGNLGTTERETMREIWEEAYRRTQAQVLGMETSFEDLTEGQTASVADVERFKRLIEDLEEADFYGDA